MGVGARCGPSLEISLGACEHSCSHEISRGGPAWIASELAPPPLAVLLSRDDDEIPDGSHNSNLAEGGVVGVVGVGVSRGGSEVIIVMMRFRLVWDLGMLGMLLFMLVWVVSWRVESRRFPLGGAQVLHSRVHCAADVVGIG